SLRSRRPLGGSAARRIAALASAVTTLACGGCGAAHGGSGAVPPPPAHAGVFRDMAREAGIEFRWSHGGRSPLYIIETLGHGAAFTDYDRDGMLDAFLVGNRGCALFRNLGGGRFQDVTRQAGIAAEGDFCAVAAGDYDNDGYPDLYVTGYGKCVL